jgi:HAMP domain-containing protein
MTLRRRYYFAVVPLLLGLGIVSALVLIHLVRSETLWGLQQRAEGVAASIAEFLPVLEAADADAQLQRLAEVVRRLGPASITVHDWPPDQQAPRWQYAADRVALPPPPGELLATLQTTGLAWRHLPAEAGQPARILGYALAYDDTGQPRALVAVVEHDDTLGQSLQALEGQLLWIAAGLLLLGCLIAEWLTRSVQSELGRLIVAAGELEAGRNADGWQPGRIREVNDLGGTLQTMGSLLQDGVQRIRIGFFDAATIPTRQAKAQHVQRRQIEALRAQGTLQGVLWRALGSPPPEHVLVWRIDPAGWTAVLGTLGGVDQADPLDRALLAQALGRHLLGAGADAADPMATQALLGDASMIRICWHSGQVRVDGWGAASAYRGSPGRTRDVYGTLDPEALQIARMYLAQTSDRSLAQVVAELESLLGERYSGFLWAYDNEGRS